MQEFPPSIFLINFSSSISNGGFTATSSIVDNSQWPLRNPETSWSRSGCSGGPNGHRSNCCHCHWTGSVIARERCTSLGDNFGSARVTRHSPSSDYTKCESHQYWYVVIQSSQMLEFDRPFTTFQPQKKKKLEI